MIAELKTLKKKTLPDTSGIHDINIHVNDTKYFKVDLFQNLPVSSFVVLQY